MPTVRDYFRTESADCLGSLDRLLSADRAEPAALHRLARTLRGVAQMAREERTYRAAVALEAACRALARDELSWDDDTTGRFRDTVADLRALVDGVDPEPAEEARVAAVLDRWLGLGVALPEREVAGPAAPRTTTAAPERRNGEDAFRAFVAREVAAIAGVLSAGVDALMARPLDREPLKTILRRQRILLGTARLDELSVVAEALRAVEDISRVIARLDVAIKDEWLDVFRSAREVMRAASAALDRGEEPGHTNALSRLRTLHTELIERYGAAETGPASAVVPTVIAHAAAAGSEQTRTAPAAATDAEPLDIADLMYDRDEAMRRMAELRPRIERAVRQDADARAALDELFDLIRSLAE
jgi:chemotaxis protein histidine kinase CheA